METATKKGSQWFEVSREGLRQLQEGKPKHFILRELIQNAWDEDGSKCDVRASWKNGLCSVTVADDSPEGFRDLTHAFTVFAPTYKRSDPEKRGRFNLGEKQALAVCEYAKISTTKGAVLFNKEGRTETNERTRSGSIVEVAFKCTKEEYEELMAAIRAYLPPKDLAYVINGERVKYRAPFRVIEEVLPTVQEIENALRPTRRKTAINILTCEGKGTLFEMGIPVCEIDCDYDVDVQQKIPLTPDRESVPEKYLAQIFTHVYSATFDQLPEGSISRAWVRVALEHPHVKPDAVKEWVRKIYGDKVVVANVKDRNSIDEAISKGYRVIYPSELSKEIWTNIKTVEKASGEDLMPSTSELFGSEITTEAKPVEPTENMLTCAALAKKIAKRCLGVEIQVVFKAWDGSVAAQYGSRTLTFNVRCLGKAWFDVPVSAKVLDLILHELGHEEGNHTEHDYHDAITRMAGQLIVIALSDPLFFTVDAFEEGKA